MFVEVQCPPLPKVPVGIYVPAECDDGTMRFYSNCELRCPDGYHIGYGPTSMTTDSRVCNLNGTWDYREVSPTCKGTSKRNHSLYAHNAIIETPLSGDPREVEKVSAAGAGRSRE